ncbi:GspE/PulE family protein [Aquimarina sp. 2201CG5-10]|uniref:GspE/PulE family protein n=1 Tax=Aquimarina callyspongiae TaxID=3098150 RepID=UPI002AB5506D|nr:GspE/PulE family protein [Aquimarina sp. 2201CG5-10]MDY8138470.1 GspE/PulE family protein [Aquimarina sp. 2201CG5-10]
MNTANEIILTTEEQQIINADLAHNYGIIPKKDTVNTIDFFIDESQEQESIIDELELIIGKSVRLHPVASEIIQKALISYYRIGDNSTKDRNQTESFRSASQDFLEELIFEAKAIGSSDIHFEVFKDEARIRYRIDGKLIEKYKIEKENYLELVNKIKIKSNLDITEKRLPQDGRINYDEFDIRVSILPTLHGEKIVMRILGRDTGHLSIDKLGLEDKEKHLYLEALKASKGIILISGPTGSGKTTTLYASLKLLNKVTSNIVTVEDPIEYTLKGINQVQLREDIGLSFTSALKTFLRQDPDVIMLGEIRDGATAEMAIRASLTGHLVLSTIHTNSALGTISRLIDMGVPAFLIAETLKISVAQRLVRKLCNSCKTESSLTKGEYKNEAFDQIEKHWLPKGCENCHYTGYKGRTAIYEVIPIDSKLTQEIKKNSVNLEESISDYTASSLSGKAMRLIQNGITSIEEVYSIIIEG